MRTLGRVARKPQETGKFLPTVFPTLEQKGIRIREGTVTFIAAPAGAMKTALALYWVGRTGLPALYFSADCEPFEVVERVGAMMTGDTASEVRRDPSQYAERIDTLPIRWVFEDSPSYNDVSAEVAAYAEVYGEFPRIIVIDNMLNLTGENEDEWAAHRDHARVVHRLARVTSAAVIVLAHMADDRVDSGTRPQPRSKLQGKISHLPKVILSLAFDGRVVKVAPVKNRFGPADPSGYTYVELPVSPTTNRFFNSVADQQRGAPA